MSFSWAHFFELAQELARRSDEASQWSAVSRAYYAAFHTARRYVQARLPDVRLSRGGDDHYHVWDCLKRGSREERAAAIKGKSLYDARRRADYEGVSQISPRAMTDALENARGVLRTLSLPED